MNCFILLCMVVKLKYNCYGNITLPSFSLRDIRSVPLNNMNIQLPYLFGDSSGEDDSRIDDSEQVTASASSALSDRVIGSGRQVAQNYRRGGGGSAGGGRSSSGPYMSITNLYPLLRNFGGSSIQY